MKNSFILLRKNKESGPFSLEQLLALQPGPDDLVWVEGQSVAWLRPSEVPALRNVVSDTVKVEQKETKSEQPVAVMEQHESGKEINSDNTSALKSNVYVSIPESMKKYIPEEKAAPLAVAGIPVEFEKEIPQTKYERPLDDIKEMYVKTLEERKKKIARKKNVTRVMKYAVIILALVAIGAFAGIVIQKKTSGKTAAQIKPSIQQIQQSPAQQEVVIPPDNQGSPDADSEMQQQNSSDANSDQKSTPGNLKNEPVASGKSEGLNEPSVISKEESGKTSERTGEKRNETKNEVVFPGDDMTSIRSRVAVKANDYKTGTFGGIRGLQLTLTNESDYSLEKVTVELQYLKLGDEVVKSEFVQFLSVPANGSQTIDIPSSRRGVKVVCKVRSIDPEEKSSAAGF